jgi:hypothetical protein
MTGLLEVSVCVLVLGLFAASDMTACQTHSKGRPGITQFDAFCAYISSGFHTLDLRQVAALFHPELSGPRLTQKWVDQLLYHALPPNEARPPHLKLTTAKLASWAGRESRETIRSVALRGLELDATSGS